MNRLKVSLQQAILTLARHGKSRRAIARELGIDRSTVASHLGVRSKPAISTAGSEEAGDSKPAISTTGFSKPFPLVAISTAGSAAGRKSLCDEWREQILDGCQSGLTAKRIHQDLVSIHGFKGSYESVKRYVRKVEGVTPLPFRRMECAPGEEAQVDFGKGAWVASSDGTKRRPHLFRIVLSHSRKAYSEVVERQTTESFIRCLENAFRHFGGVPQKLVIDNLKAAVTKAHWYDPTLNPKILSFAAHYGTVIMPTKPYTPRHKGKIEAGVKFVQDNALKARSFGSLAEQNAFLLDWEKRVADTRIHGTTRQQVEQLFESVERPRLLPLPAMIFPAFSEAPRTVHQDGHVEVAKTYYSVPPEYVGQKVWVRWEISVVRIFNQRMEQIAMHARSEPGRFNTNPSHIDSRKRSPLENGPKWLLQKVNSLGQNCGAWAEAMLANRGVQGIRVLQGFLNLATKHLPKDMEAASELALAHSSWHLSELQSLLSHPQKQEHFAFAQKHPLIRDLSHYQALVPNCFDPHPVTETTNAIEHESSSP